MVLAALAVALLAGAVLPDAVADPVGAGAFAPQVMATAGITNPRMLSTAASPSFLMSVFVPPGIDTTSWSLPWITTVASVTPVPFTRSWMMCCACSIDDLDGALPFGVFASKMT